MRCLGEEERKTKTKDACLEKGSGSAPDLSACWKQAGTLRGGAMETSSCVSERAEGGRAPSESVSGEGSGLPRWPLLPRTRNEALGTCGRRKQALGAPGIGFGKMVKGECYQKSPKTQM